VQKGVVSYFFVCGGEGGLTSHTHYGNQLLPQPPPTPVSKASWDPAQQRSFRPRDRISSSLNRGEDYGNNAR
jgi:hypothetical protein